jgi:hypothetical protein
MKVSCQIHVPAIVPQGKQTQARMEWKVGMNIERVSVLWIREKHLPLLEIRILTLRSPSSNLLLLAVASNPALKYTHENI